MELVTVSYDLSLTEAVKLRDNLDQFIDEVIGQRKARKAAKDKKRKSNRG